MTDQAHSSSVLDEATQRGLQLLADSVTLLAGFRAATIRLATDAGFAELARAVHHEGDPEPEDPPVADHIDTPEALDAFFREGLVWGRWALASQVGLAADSWHRSDRLVAKLSDGDGRVVGFLELTHPLVTARTPGHLTQLELYAKQTERAIALAGDQLDLMHQFTHVEGVRRVVRAATMHPDPDDFINETHRELISSFGAQAVYVTILDSVGGGEYGHDKDRGTIAVPAEMSALAHEGVARLAPTAREVLIGQEHAADPVFSPEETAAIQSFLATELGVTSMLTVPLVNQADEFIGCLSLGRTSHDPPWGHTERQAALAAGRDLADAILAGRSLTRSQLLVERFRRLDSAKSELISEVYADLIDPLAQVRDHVESLGRHIARGERTAPGLNRSVVALKRATFRMQRVIDDLHLLAIVGDPHTPLPDDEVELDSVLKDVVEQNSIGAQKRSIEIVVDLADDLVVLGSSHELDRLLTNLVSNAIKYSHDGGQVTVSGEKRGAQIIIAVSDLGLGISDDDQQHLFTEFFRSTNAAALDVAGTGLGLAIAARIARRHGGKLHVRSELGRGSTFSVSLPGA